MTEDKNKIIENLKAANCNDSLIKEFFQLKTDGKLRLLSQHRKNLLEALHKNQKQIDCLDYLIFNIEKYKGEINGTYKS